MRKAALRTPLLLSGHRAFSEPATSVSDVGFPGKESRVSKKIVVETNVGVLADVAQTVPL